MLSKKSTFMKILLLGLILVMATMLAGCPGQQAEKPQQDQQQGQQKDQQQANIDITALIADWENSGHGRYLAYPAGRENCVTCHDGYAFANQISDPAKLPEGKKFVTGGGEGEEAEENAEQTSTGTSPINCTACHTGQGVELMKAGQVSVPAKENLQAGKSAMCLACHNPRKKADINNKERVYPHYGSQSDVLFAIGGMMGEGMKIDNHPHAKIDNPCIACHMTENGKGIMSHTFKVTDQTAAKACGECHKDIKAINLEAKGDYDGDGNTEGLQDEVTGLLDVVKVALQDKLNGGTFEAQGGSFVFKDKNGQPVTEVSNEIYMAAWNHALVNFDGSKGIHNPNLAIQILQQSYKALTGNDVPKAKIK